MDKKEILKKITNDEEMDLLEVVQMYTNLNKNNRVKIQCVMFGLISANNSN